MKIYGTETTPGEILFSLNKPLKGACCTQTQCLPDKTEGECISLSGSWKGAGTNCGANPCEFGPGACCVCNGDCYAIDEKACDEVLSNFQHPIFTNGQNIQVQGGLYSESGQCGTTNCDPFVSGQDCDFR